MIVAELCITAMASGNAVVHHITFESLETAAIEYERLNDFMLKWFSNSAGNSKMAEIIGSNTKLRINMNHISAFTLTDFILANHQQSGTTEAFPNLLFKK
jgi:hypothetical protein